jgi:phage/plasmid-like protein (TIGR03299 family)
MAHAIDFSTGRAALAFTGPREAIWHGLGESLPDSASLAEWQTAAGMDWRIQRSKVRYAPGPGLAPIEWPDHHVLLRSDTRSPLAIVSDSFQVVQPSEVIGFFADLIREAGFKMTTAGVLHGGRKFWAQADVGMTETVCRGDFVGARLLLATACDGSMNTIAKGVSERVVCANTLGFAMSEKGGSLVKVSHRSVFDADRVKSQLGVAPTAFARFIANARELARMPLAPIEARSTVLELLGGHANPTSKTQADKAAKVMESAGYQTILALFEGKARGAEMAGPTGWGLVNAVTEYVDHYSRSRSLDNRMDSSQFGPGDGLKTAAFDRMMDMLTA